MKVSALSALGVCLGGVVLCVELLAADAPRADNSFDSHSRGLQRFGQLPPGLPLLAQFPRYEVGPDDRSRTPLRRPFPSGMVSVPNIECKDKAEADRIIRAAGLHPVSIAVHGPVDPDTCGAYQAYRQEPRPGMIVRRGTKVTYRFWWEHG